MKLKKNNNGKDKKQEPKIAFSTNILEKKSEIMERNFKHVNYMQSIFELRLQNFEK